MQLKAINFAPLLLTLLLATLCLVVSGCATSRKPVPIGEVPPPRAVTIEEEQYGHEVLSALTEEFELDYNDPRFNKIQDIVDKLTTTVGANKDPWHVYLFRAPEVKNAAATRGNHVFIWSGLLDSAQNDNELATVIAHEIAHVLSGHTEPDPNEQIRQIIVQIGAIAAGIAVAQVTRDPNLGQNLGNMTSSITEQLGSGILVNPYARDVEREADHVGLFLMADSGYNPQGAIDFWNRAQSDPSFSSSLEFFSTHPLAEDRLAELQKILPLAMERYKNRGKVKNTPLPKQKSPPRKADAPAASSSTLPAPSEGDSFDMRKGSD